MHFVLQVHQYLQNVIVIIGRLVTSRKQNFLGCSGYKTGCLSSAVKYIFIGE